MTGIDQQLPNLRRDRAKALATVLTDELRHLIPNRDLRDVYEALFMALARNGGAWTTDEERQAMGLEPRDDHGWTPSERIAEEQRRVRALRAMMAMPPAHVSMPHRMSESTMRLIGITEDELRKKGGKD